MDELRYAKRALTFCSSKCKMTDSLIEPSEQSDLPLFSLDLRDILRAVRRGKWAILASVVLVTAGFVAWTMEQERVYAARATLIVEGSLPKVLGDSFDVEEASGANRSYVFYNTQYSIMQSRSVLLETVERLGLADDDSFVSDYGIEGRGRESRLKACEGILRRNLEVVGQRDSAVVELIVEDLDPTRAATIANTIAQVYLDQSLEQRLAASRGASEWLDQRLEEFARRLDASQEALYRFKKENMLVSVSVEERRNMTSARLTALNQSLIEVRESLIALEAERAVIQEAINTGELAALTSIPRVQDNELVQKLRSSLVDLEQHVAELSSRYGEKHPNIAAVRDQSERTRGLLDTEMALVVDTLDNEISSLRATESRLRREMRVETDKAMALNNLGLEYSRLSRDVGTNQETYKSLLKRQTETDLSGQLESHFARLLETAEPRFRPIRPSLVLNVALGIVLGLLLGIALAVGSMLLDSAVHSQDDVEDRLGLGFLGILPSIDSKGSAAGANRDLYIAQNPDSSVAEYARSLRTNLLFLSTATGDKMKHILLSSAGPAEGKTTTTIALATTTALAGNRILVIDTDLRRPRLHKAFEVSGDVGLTSVLLGSSTVDDAIRATGVKGLDLLPCGPRPPNPSELLHTDRFRDLLMEVGERYDRILLDSPPLNAVTDAAILAQQVQGTILVIKASRTSFDAARLATRRLRDVQANLLGVVLNQVDTSRGNGYKNYYYYQSDPTYGRDAEEPA